LDRCRAARFFWIAGEALRGMRSAIAAINDFTDAQLQSRVIQARGWLTIGRPTRLSSTLRDYFKQLP
jgi:hypothetical protein